MDKKEKSKTVLFAKKTGTHNQLSGASVSEVRKMSNMKAYEGDYSYEGSFKHRKDVINELEVRAKFRTWEVYVNIAANVPTNSMFF